MSRHIHNPSLRISVCFAVALGLVGTPTIPLTALAAPPPGDRDAANQRQTKDESVKPPADATKSTTTTITTTTTAPPTEPANPVGPAKPSEPAEPDAPTAPPPKAQGSEPIVIIHKRDQPTPEPTAPTEEPPPVNANAGLGLTIAGWTIFGVSYLMTAFAGATVIDVGRPEIGRPLLIPIAGPFIATSRVDSAVGGFGLVAMGVLQTLGLVMGIAGSVKLGKARSEARARGQITAGPGGLEIQF